MPMQETQHLHETILRSSSTLDRQTISSLEEINCNAAAPSEPPLREMLQKLHVLKMIAEQTNTELHLLERMIHRVLEVE